MESFFHSLKAELVHQHRFISDAQLNGQLGGASSASTTSNAFIPAWGTIPRSSSSAWPMPLAKCPPNRMKIKPLRGSA